MEPAKRLKSLNERASNFPFDSNIPLRKYARSTKEMERMALVYASENQYENSYLLYMKLITLVVEKIPKHKEYKVVDVETKSVFTKRCKQALVAAEKLKNLLKVHYNKEYTVFLQQEKQRKEALEEELKRETENQRQQQKQLQQSKQNNTYPNNALGSFAQNPDQQLPTYPNGTSNSGSPNQQLPYNQTIGSYPNVPNISSNDRQQPKADLPPSYDQAVLIKPISPTELSTFTPSFTPTAPTAPPSAPFITDFNTQLDFNDTPYTKNTSPIPQVNRAGKPNHLITTPDAIPVVNRNQKPDILRQDSSSSISSLDGNRLVIIPSDLTSKFLQLASSNTAKNLETCGILTGKLSHNTLRITHLVIPKQSATPDSCTTECEEEMFDVQDKYDLITLGWIHTHPSQTSFLSSVDLHTQCSYQQLMPEAIAIVCAPKYNTTGIYRLTPSYGLNYITSCTKSGFHPHPKNPPLFEDSPLVSMDTNASTQVVDIR